MVGQRGQAVRQLLGDQHRSLEHRTHQRGVPLLGDHAGQCGVGGHVRQPVRRVGRVQRDVGAAGLEDGEQGDHQVRAALQADADQRLGADPELAQAPGQAVRAAVQLAVAERHALVGDGRLLRRQGGLPLEHLVHAQAFVAGRGGGDRPVDDLQLAGRQERGRGVAVGVGGHRLDDGAVEGADPFGVGAGEGVGVAGQGEAAAEGGDGQSELGVALVDYALCVDLAEVDLVEVLVVEHHVDQASAVAEFALDDRHREAAARPHRDLVGEHLLDRLPPGGGGAAGRERQGVEVHAVHPVGADGLGAAVADQAGAEGRLLGEQAEHLEVRRHQDVLQGGAGADGEQPQLRFQVLVGNLDAVVLARLSGVRAPAGRQRERRVLVEHALPEGAVLGGGDGVEFGGDEVGEAHGRGLGHQRRPAGPQRAERLQGLHQQGVVAPALQDRVALGDGDPPAVPGGEVGGDPDQRRHVEVERVGALGGGELPDGGLLSGLVEGAQVVDGDLRFDLAVHQLQRGAVRGELEGGAQHLVAGDHLVHGPAQRVRVEGPVVADPEGGDVVVRVGAAAGQEFGDHAELDLGERVGVGDPGGQGGADGRVDQLEGCHGRGRRGRGLPVAEVLGEGGDRAVLEDVADGDVVVGLAQDADQGDGADGVAAEVEEGGVDADPLQAQRLAPDLGDPLLGDGPRRGEGLVLAGAGALGGGQGAPVGLAVAGEREGVEPDEGGRDHVAGEALAEQGPQVGGGGSAVGFGGPVGDQFLAARAVLAGDDDGLAHPRVGGDGGLDLAEFDPVAADLHLVVGPADELQGAVREAAGQVAGAVQPGAGRAERVGDEALGGEVGPVEVAAGDSGAADVDLADDSDRHQPAVLVEQVDTEVGQRAADRADRGRGEVGAGEAVEGGVHGGLCDAVHVDQRGGVRAEPVGPRPQVADLQLLAAEDHVAQGEPVDPRVAGAGQGDQRAERGRGLAEHGDALGDQQVEQLLGRAGDVEGDHGEAAAEQQGAPQLPDGHVEGVGVEQ